MVAHTRKTTTSQNMRTPTSPCRWPIPGRISHFFEVGTEADIQALYEEGIHHEAGHGGIAGIGLPQRGVAHHAAKHLDGDVGARHTLN